MYVSSKPVGAAWRVRVCGGCYESWLIIPAKKERTWRAAPWYAGLMRRLYLFDRTAPHKKGAALSDRSFAFVLMSLASTVGT